MLLFPPHPASSEIYCYRITVQGASFWYAISTPWGSSQVPARYLVIHIRSLPPKILAPPRGHLGGTSIGTQLRKMISVKTGNGRNDKMGNGWMGSPCTELTIWGPVFLRKLHWLIQRREGGDMGGQRVWMMMTMRGGTSIFHAPTSIFNLQFSIFNLLSLQNNLQSLRKPDWGKIRCGHLLSWTLKVDKMVVGGVGKLCFVLFQTSCNVSVTHLNLGLPTLLLGGSHGTNLMRASGAKVLRLTGCCLGINLILAGLFILAVR